MLNFYLIRHGQSEVNARPDEIGQSPDVPLTKLGREQSFKLNSRLRKENIYFDRVYSSPYLRALDTAKIVCGEYCSSIDIVPDLREYSAGDWTGKSRSEILTIEKKLAIANFGNSFLFPNGDSMNRVERRVSQWLEDSILYNDDFKKLKSVNIGIFSHGMTIKCLLHYVLGFNPSILWKISIENTSVTNLIFDKDGWRVVTVNDHYHLKL